MARLEPIIEAKGMHIIYNPGQANEFHAIKGVNIDIYPGEYIGLFGASGSGKSTLLYNFLGVLPYQEGELRVTGVDPYKLPTMEKVHFLRETIGIIYQAFYLIPSITVIENVSLPLTFAGLEKKEREGRAQRVLDRFGVGHTARKFPTMVSGGQLQRASVSRAVTTNPHILLADEPTGNLDTVSAKAVLDSLEEINAEGQTVVMITHNAAQLRLCHRIYYLEDGYVVREVANPEKKQIKKQRDQSSIVTEIEKLARIYPLLTPKELRVKSIANYLMDELSFEEITRAEKLIEMLIDGRISPHHFGRALAIPPHEGGPGLHTNVAEKMAQRAATLLEEARDITRYRRVLGNVPMADPDQRKLVRRLRDSMLGEYAGSPKREQIEQLDAAITDRVRGAYTPEAFEVHLSQTVAEGGPGFSVVSARNLARHLEKLLAQGIEHDGQHL